VSIEAIMGSYWKKAKYLPENRSVLHNRAIIGSMRRILIISLVVLAGCEQGFVNTTYNPLLPSLPVAWEGILGKPHWRLEWAENGNWVSWEGKTGFPQISPDEEWTSPLLAWPFWPEKAIPPGLMYPAGALSPWDISGKSLVLSWKAGVDALFWQKLSENEETQQKSGTPRLPWFFDWPRFRELMESEDIPLEVRKDPWLADWSSIAQKTVESGFDRRRIKAEPRTEISIPWHDDFWISTNPFVEPISLRPGQALVIPVKGTPETWLSSSGLLRCHKEAWIFIPWNGK
jgi:hypothetical protein